MCVCAQPSYTTQYKTDMIIFSLNLVNVHMLPIAGEGILDTIDLHINRNLFLSNATHGNQFPHLHSPIFPFLHYHFYY